MYAAEGCRPPNLSAAAIAPLPAYLGGTARSPSVDASMRQLTGADDVRWNLRLLKVLREVHQKMVEDGNSVVAVRAGLTADDHRYHRQHQDAAERLRRGPPTPTDSSVFFVPPYRAASLIRGLHRPTSATCRLPSSSSSSRFDSTGLHASGEFAVQRTPVVYLRLAQTVPSAAVPRASESVGRSMSHPTSIAGGAPRRVQSGPSSLLARDTRDGMTTGNEQQTAAEPHEPAGQHEPRCDDAAPREDMDNGHPIKFVQATLTVGSSNVAMPHPISAHPLVSAAAAGTTNFVHDGVGASPASTTHGASMVVCVAPYRHPPSGRTEPILVERRPAAPHRAADFSSQGFVAASELDAIAAAGVYPPASLPLGGASLLTPPEGGGPWWRSWYPASRTPTEPPALRPTSAKQAPPGTVIVAAPRRPQSAIIRRDKTAPRAVASANASVIGQALVTTESPCGTRPNSAVARCDGGVTLKGTEAAVLDDVPNDDDDDEPEGVADAALPVFKDHVRVANATAPATTGTGGGAKMVTVIHPFVIESDGSSGGVAADDRRFLVGGDASAARGSPREGLDVDLVRGPTIHSVYTPRHHGAVEPSSANSSRPMSSRDILMRPKALLSRATEAANARSASRGYRRPGAVAGRVRPSSSMFDPVMTAPAALAGVSGRSMLSANADHAAEEVVAEPNKVTKPRMAAAAPLTASERNSVAERFAASLYSVAPATALHSGGRPLHRPSKRAAEQALLQQPPALRIAALSLSAPEAESALERLRRLQSAV